SRSNEIMAEQILLGFFWCSIASLALVAITSQSNFFASILSIIIEFLLILKDIWDCSISHHQSWNRYRLMGTSYKSISTLA
ncbi:hypothetical protein KEM48_000604, partial [Puccinia striiformis f. sp. tritici PST-130]